MTALLLYIMDQHRSMITIRHGMIDHYTERQHPAIMNLMVTSENNNRKIHLPRSRCVMSHSCERNPRYTGYRCKGIRTIRLGRSSVFRESLTARRISIRSALCMIHRQTDSAFAQVHSDPIRTTISRRSSVTLVR